MRASEETTAYWKQQVEAFQKSGMSRAAYCEQNQLKIYQFDYWRKRLLKPKLKCTDSRPGWIPLQVNESAGQDMAGGIRLKVGQLEIEIRRGFDRELLAEVLRVVGQAC
jgi:hypothetical protein